MSSPVRKTVIHAAPSGEKVAALAAVAGASVTLLVTGLLSGFMHMHLGPLTINTHNSVALVPGVVGSCGLGLSAGIAISMILDYRCYKAQMQKALESKEDRSGMEADRKTFPSQENQCNWSRTIYRETVVGQFKAILTYNAKGCVLHVFRSLADQQHFIEHHLKSGINDPAPQREVPLNSL